MRGLSSFERVILECLGEQNLSYEEVQRQTGLHENVCFNLLQALVIRGIVATTGSKFGIKAGLSPLMLEELNGGEAKKAESLELMEAVVDKTSEKVFRFQKVALDAKDEMLFLAMLANLDSFLKESHQKSQKDIPLKNRKVVFWGVAEVEGLIAQVVTGGRR
jgi:hypothetical protein